MMIKYNQTDYIEFSSLSFFILALAVAIGKIISGSDKQINGNSE